MALLLSVLEHDIAQSQVLGIQFSRPITPDFVLHEHFTRGGACEVEPNNRPIGINPKLQTNAVISFAPTCTDRAVFQVQCLFGMLQGIIRRGVRFLHGNDRDAQSADLQMPAVIAPAVRSR